MSGEYSGLREERLERPELRVQRVGGRPEGRGHRHTGRHVRGSRRAALRSTSRRCRRPTRGAARPAIGYSHQGDFGMWGIGVKHFEMNWGIPGDPPNADWMNVPPSHVAHRAAAQRRRVAQPVQRGRLVRAPGEAERELQRLYALRVSHGAGFDRRLRSAGEPLSQARLQRRAAVPAAARGQRRRRLRPLGEHRGPDHRRRPAARAQLADDRPRGIRVRGTPRVAHHALQRRGAIRLQQHPDPALRRIHRSGVSDDQFGADRERVHRVGGRGAAVHARK